MDIKQAFETFEKAVAIARAERNDLNKKAMASALSLVLDVANKMPKDVWHEAKNVDRSTLSRWIAGKTVPHPRNVMDLRKYLVSRITEVSFAQKLHDPKYRPIMELLVSRTNSDRTLTESDVNELVELIEKSKGILSVPMLLAYLGLT